MLSTTRCPIPIYMAPTGQNRVAHPDGEYNTLRASAATGVPMILSNASSVSLEEALDERQRLSRTQPPAPFWWQLYIRKDRTKNEEQIKQAAAGGVDAIVITVDVTALGNREGDAAHPERAKEQDHGKEYEIRGLTPLLSGQLDGEQSASIMTAKSMRMTILFDGQPICLGAILPGYANWRPASRSSSKALPLLKILSWRTSMERPA